MSVWALGLEFHFCQTGLTNRESRIDIEKMVACQVRAVREYDEDWAVVMPDDYMSFEPLGLDMRDDENRATMPTSYLPITRETLNGFRIPDPQKEMRIPIYLEMLRRLKQALGDDVLVMGHVAAPFSSLGLIYGIEALMVGLLSEPDLVKENVKFFVDYQTAFGWAQLEAGADLLWLGDCCAGSKFVRAEHFAEFAFGSAAQVADQLVKAGGLVIYHNAETSLAHLKYQSQLPVHALNLGAHAKIPEIKEKLDPQMCLMGNFDPILLRDGTPEEVAEATEVMIRENLPHGGYIFNTEEDVMVNTPPENFAAMIRKAKELAHICRVKESSE